MYLFGRMPLSLHNVCYVTDLNTYLCYYVSYIVHTICIDLTTIISIRFKDNAITQSKTPFAGGYVVTSTSL